MQVKQNCEHIHTYKYIHTSICNGGKDLWQKAVIRKEERE